MVKISIIIPCYNEFLLIEQAILSVLKLDLGNLEKEVIVIDDGSTDGSKEIILKMQGIKFAVHEKNRGKGAAMRTGYELATGDICCPYDADREYDERDILKVVEPILDGQAEVVYGSRRLNKDNKQYSAFSYYLGGIVITWATNILYGSHITDEPTCFKVFLKTVLNAHPFQEEGFDWEPAITAKILKAGIKIYEVPIRYYPRDVKHGKKIHYADGIRALYTLFKYRFFD